jgi:hypothetical protein
MSDTKSTEHFLVLDACGYSNVGPCCQPIGCFPGPPIRLRQTNSPAYQSREDTEIFLDVRAAEHVAVSYSMIL